MRRLSSSLTARSPQRYWPNDEAARQTNALPTREGPVWATIVGIVGDLHHRGLDQPVKPEFYVPLLQAPYPSVILAVRSTQDATSLTSAIRARSAGDRSRPCRSRMSAPSSR